VSVLVRPHPQRAAEWNGVDLSAFGPVSVWGANPVDARARADYFDSLYFARTVVGLNTSALIEAAIVDRPVHGVLLPEFSPMQEGTHHFRYLLEGPHAFLRIARDLPGHVAQIAEAMEDGEEPRNRRFVEHFVRPYGRAVASTPVFADAVEALGALRPVPMQTAWTRPGPLVRAARAAAATEWGRRLIDDPVALREQREREARLADKQTLVEASRRLREQKEEDKRRRWRDKRRRERVVRLKTALRRMLPGLGRI
jgi:hypothetical protein